NQTTQLWMNENQLTPEARAQLNKVDIRSYASFFSDLLVLFARNDISKIWFSASASQAIFSRIPVQKRLIASSPVELVKATKNSAEQQGIRDCGIRDGVARVRHLAWLEDQINNNANINETRSA
ncbi:unnamed protein product, partial [Adineta steineri]